MVKCLICNKWVDCVSPYLNNILCFKCLDSMCRYCYLYTSRYVALCPIHKIQFYDKIFDCHYCNKGYRWYLTYDLLHHCQIPIKNKYMNVNVL